MLHGVTKPHPLPRWVIPNDESVRRETAQSRRQTPAERWRDVIAACEILKFYWNLPGYPERIRKAVDPLPQSSRDLWARLREDYRRGRR